MDLFVSEKNHIDSATKQGRKRASTTPKHRARTLQKMLNENALDRRTAVSKMLRQVERDLASDSGGEQQLTNREKVLIRSTAALILITSSVEAYAFKQKSLLTDGAELLPALGKSYLAFANSLRLNLLALGLKPEKPKEEADLSEYVRQRAEEATR